MEKTDILRAYLEILVDGPTWKKGKPEETAILILPGYFQEYRIEQGVKLWRGSAKYLFIGPTRKDTFYTSREKIIELLGEDSPDILFGETAANTLEQMQWVSDVLKEHTDIKHIIVTTSAYHLPRCCLTLLNVLQKNNQQIAISPHPLQNPRGDSFSVEGTEDFALEIEKIQEYQTKGDVLSCDDWKKYLDWRLTQI